MVKVKNNTNGVESEFTQEEWDKIRNDERWSGVFSEIKQPKIPIELLKKNEPKADEIKAKEKEKTEESKPSETEPDSQTDDDKGTTKKNTKKDQTGDDKK